MIPFTVRYVAGLHGFYRVMKWLKVNARGDTCVLVDVTAGVMRGMWVYRPVYEERKRMTVGERYKITGPRFSAVYAITFVHPDLSGYFSAKRSPKPTRLCRDGFGDHLQSLAQSHTFKLMKRGIGRAI